MSSSNKVVTSFDEIHDNGEFKRKPTSFHDVITAADVEAGRFHLYVSLACPWASRCLAALQLKGIGTDVVPVHTVKPVWGVVDPESGGKGWVFGEKGEQIAGVDVSDPLYGFKTLRELYLKNDSDYTGKNTVPVLWDAKEGRIVNNESSEILRMFNGAFNRFATRPELDLSPANQLAEIDAVNESFYNSLNNGVYRAGFAKTQQAYETAVDEVFAKLAELEKHLSTRQFLVGNALTESDLRLFVTLIRFDAVYVLHFKCNLARLQDFPVLQAYTRRLFLMPEIKRTVNFEHIKHHYFGSHPLINPLGIVPKGPILQFQE